MLGLSCDEGSNYVRIFKLLQVYVEAFEARLKTSEAIEWKRLRHNRNYESGEANSDQEESDGESADETRNDLFDDETDAGSTDDEHEERSDRASSASASTANARPNQLQQPDERVESDLNSYN